MIIKFEQYNINTDNNKILNYIILILIIIFELYKIDNNKIWTCQIEQF